MACLLPTLYTECSAHQDLFCLHIFYFSPKTDRCCLQGICHRDISLKNILILHGENISAKICDFGWSKDPVIQSAMRTRAGTSLFAAPEVLNNTGESYTHKADCWSLGIVLYYLLFGVTPYTCLPYKRDDHDEIMNRAMQGTWSFPTEAAIQERRVSPGAKELIRKLLQKDPNQRCTAREILVDPWTFDTIEERDIAMQYNDNTVLFQRDHTVTGHREVCIDIEYLLLLMFDPSRNITVMLYFFVAVREA